MFTKGFPFRLRPALLACLFGLTATFTAAETYSPILVETAGSGPKERVVRFKVNPLAEFYPLERQLPLMPSLAAAIDAGENHRETLRRELEDQAFRQGLAIFSIGVGLGGAFTTVLEQGYVDDAFPAAISSRVFPRLSSGLNYLGLALTYYQILMGPATGDDRPVILNAYKGVMSFMAGRFGTPGIQLAMIAGLPIDVSLTYFGEAAWSAREDAWRQSYAKYYRETEQSAQDRYYGSVGQLPPTLDERVAEIRNRTEGGRTINEWKLVLAWYLDNINRPEKFNSVMHTEVRNYVSLFWESARFSEYAADVDQATAGMARGASLTKEIKKKLEDEHYSVIMGKLIDDVLPEIARDRFINALEAQVARLNRAVRPELNAPLRLEVSAFGLEAPTKFHMPLRDGDTWSGTLRPGEPLRIALTKLAWLRAGFPDTIRLDHPEGAMERTFVFEQDEALVVFGTPEAEGLITSFRREEGPQDCIITTRSAGRPDRRTQEQRPAQPGETLQTAVSPEKYLLLGQFNGAEWTAAAPGRVVGTARAGDAETPALGQGDAVFAAPYFERITAISDCEAKVADDPLGQMTEPFRCRVHRLHRERAGDGGETVTRCTADLRLELAGAWHETADGHEYVPFDRDQLEMIGREYQNMLDRLPGAGIQ